MQAILMLVRQLNEGRAEVENEFTRAVTPQGNERAKRLVADVFELRRSFEWRGLGEVPYSALAIKERYRAFDAEARYGIVCRPVPDHKACECGAILRGVKKPIDCKVFGTVCTPENPIGSCMVSSGGGVRGTLRLRAVQGRKSGACEGRDACLMKPAPAASPTPGRSISGMAAWT